MKTAIPTDDDRTVGKVFGRAKSFAIHDSEDGSLTVVPNEGAGAEHGAGIGRPPSWRSRGSGRWRPPRWDPRRRRPWPPRESKSGPCPRERT